jgi:DivIVA domain-containing protein
VTAAASSPRTNDELVHRIESMRFTTVRFREGYDMGEVDRFLERTVEAIRQSQPVLGMVNDVRITPVRLRVGYDMVEVDEFLDLITETADRLTGAGAPAAADPVEPRQESPDRVSSPYPSVISEEPGLFGKVFRRNR